MSATPATPATPASPSAKKVAGKPNVALRFRSLIVDVGYGLVAFVLAAIILDNTAPGIVDPGFWPSIGAILVIPLLLLAVWLAVNEQVVPSRTARALIILVLLIAVALYFGLGVGTGFLGAINWGVLWSAFWVVLAIFAEAFLFWLRRRAKV